jgi:hypothetical protein
MIFYGDDSEFVSRTSIRKSQDVLCVGGFTLNPLEK